MNSTEKIAQAWIAKREHLNKEDVIFRPNVSPDFVTLTGIGYEVKSPKFKNITMTKHQWESLLHFNSCYLLIYKSSFEPEYIIKAKDILIGGYSVDGYSIKIKNNNVAPTRHMNYKNSINPKNKIERNNRISAYKLQHPTMSYANIGRVFRHIVNGKSVPLNASVIYRIINRKEKMQNE
ncbi:MAG: hypothetical protein WC389_19780 [Lutibacter sp.]|jgi:hypothetical protein